jgi:hypothetical protein
MKVVKLSALRTGRLYPMKYSWYSFLLGAESTGSVVGRIMLMKNSFDTIGNLTRYLPASSPVSQPTAPLRITYN